MIDISNEVYTLVVNALIAEFGENAIGTSSVYTNTPSKYPFVSVEEIENMVDEGTSDSCHLENHAILQYEVIIYAKDPQKRSKAYQIAEVVDNVLASYNFTRISKNPVQDPSNETVYRLIMRYDATVSQDHTIYRR